MNDTTFPDQTQAFINMTEGFEGSVLDPIPLQDAIDRVLAYCTYSVSGWGAYDLVGIHARRSNAFDEVSVWSLLLANALNGRVTLTDLAGFTQAQRASYAAMLERIPADLDLHKMDSGQVDHVIDACKFGFPGVWGPKITKVGALYRPRSIPVLDGYIAEAFGFSAEAFSQGKEPRWRRIGRVVRAFAEGVRDHQRELKALRAAVQPIVPDLVHISDLRLLDIVLWTSQDDRRQPRRKAQGPPWDKRTPGSATPLAAFAPVHVPPS